MMDFFPDDTQTDVQFSSHIPYRKTNRRIFDFEKDNETLRNQSLSRYQQSIQSTQPSFSSKMTSDDQHYHMFDESIDENTDEEGSVIQAKIPFMPRYKNISNFTSKINPLFRTPSLNNYKNNFSDLNKTVAPETPRDLCIPVNVGGKHGEMLKSVREIPEKYRSVFPFSYFNALQSKVFDEVMYSDNPMVVCAPTGSGKTVIFELSIIRLLLATPDTLSYKIVYMAPIKALCSERSEEWNKKFSPFGLKCTELTGDTNLDDFLELQRSHIVLTTPEKWDSMTRKWKDQKCLVQSIRLFLIDEVHLLNDNTRGATMEAVVSRMKTIQVAINNESKKDLTSKVQAPVMRILAISATIPNVEDIGMWLDTGILPAITVNVGDEYRPVALRKIVLGYPCTDKQSDFKFDLTLNYKLSNIIQTYAENKPTLVFCSTRKGVAQAASVLIKDTRFNMNAQHKQTLTRYANIVHDSKLQEYLLQGVGFHHAGLDAGDRKNVEELFLGGQLPVLFSTSTLAMGVNLPAHLVVVKGTMYYGMGGFIEYSEAQVLQMIGRAGRPQFDTSATGVIMTKQINKDKYQRMLCGSQKVESSLHHHLTEHINAEVVLGTIADVNIAQEWLKSTFLYIRMCENPLHYGAPGLDKKCLAKKLHGMCIRALKSLQSLNIIEMKEEQTLIATDVGKMMARYCIAFDTVKLFSTATGQESLAELIALVAKAKEFEDIVLRQNERKLLNMLNKDKNRITIRFPMNGKIKTAEAKVNCLFQATLGCLSIIDFPLQQDSNKIFRTGQRVSKFLMEYLLTKGGFEAALNSVLLFKSIRTRLWENSKFVSRQLERIGPSLSSTLVNADITTFQKIEETNARELELIMNRNPPFGTQIKALVAGLPKLDVHIEQEGEKKSSSADVFVKIQLLNCEERQNHLEHLKSKKLFAQGYMFIVGDSDNNIIFKQKITDWHLLPVGKWCRKIKINRASKSPNLSVNLVSLDYVGLDVQSTFTPSYLINYKLDRKKPEAPLSNVSHNKGKGFTPLKPNQACNHTCINKLWCGHQCCKNEMPTFSSATNIFDASPFAESNKRKEQAQRNSSWTSSQTNQHYNKKSKISTLGNEKPFQKSGNSRIRESSIHQFCDDLQRKKTYLPNYGRPLKKIKVELTLQPSNSKCLKDYSYKPRKLNFQSDNTTDSTSHEMNDYGDTLSQVDYFQSIRKTSNYSPYYSEMNYGDNHQLFTKNALNPSNNSNEIESESDYDQYDFDEDFYKENGSDLPFVTMPDCNNNHNIKSRSQQVPEIEKTADWYLESSPPSSSVQQLYSRQKLFSQNNKNQASEECDKSSLELKYRSHPGLQTQKQSFHSCKDFLQLTSSSSNQSQEKQPLRKRFAPPPIYDIPEFNSDEEDKDCEGLPAAFYKKPFINSDSTSEECIPQTALSATGKQTFHFRNNQRSHGYESPQASYQCHNKTSDKTNKYQNLLNKCSKMETLNNRRGERIGNSLDENDSQYKFPITEMVDLNETTDRFFASNRSVSAEVQPSSNVVKTSRYEQKNTHPSIASSLNVATDEICQVRNRCFSSENTPQYNDVIHHDKGNAASRDGSNYYLERRNENKVTTWQSSIFTEAEDKEDFYEFYEIADKSHCRGSNEDSKELFSFFNDI